jgi:steroid 5-alpha reductase family enzyme
MEWNALLNVFSINLAGVAALFVSAWALSVVRSDAGVIDVFWGLGFVLVAWLSAFTGDGWIGRKVLMTALTTCWGLRLSVHIYHRNRGKEEDPRYQTFRKRGGERFWITSLWNIFLLQAALLLVIAYPLMHAQAVPNPDSLRWTDIAGTSLWIVGFIFETLGDLQLKSFLSDPANRGQVMRYGLWAWTRHPNYFGECLVWWGIFLIALSTPYGAATVIGPVLITFLLLRVSGVTLLESALKTNREGYAEYIRTTSAFFPWPPKK